MAFSEKNISNKRISSWINLGLWILVALFIRWQVIEPRWIPSGSMLPTLKVQERLLIEKVTPKINKILNKHPKLGSIVVFRPPEALIEAGYESKQALIKRIVGIPGNKIEIKDGLLLRNNVIVDEPWLSDPIKYEMKEIIVPPNSIWVLGDNRNNSFDSHYWGALPEENLLGTAVFRYWPLKKFGFIRFPASK